MKFLSTFGSVVVVALLPITLAAPAYAVPYDRLNITVDCVIGEGFEDDHVIAPGDVLTVTFTNCNGLTIEDEDNTGNATMPDSTVIVAGNTQTISSNNFAVTVVGAADLEVDNNEDVDVFVAGTIDDPSSTLLATEDVTLELSAPETMIREAMIGDPVADDGSGDIYMGALPTCEVEPGLHVYRTLNFEVTASGVYDFRAVAVSPIDEDLNWGVDKYPSSDPFLAVYEGFDPNNPEVNIVGCNDDGDDTGVAAIDDEWADGGDFFEALATEANVLLDDQWPWFQTTLAPGNYSLVYMPFSTMGTDDFALGRFGATSDATETWDPAAQTVTFEMWGPTGGLVVSEEDGGGGGGNGGAASDVNGLAETGGVEPAFALWAGLGIVGVGVAMGVARRREQRG
jgi:hypothetical protein